MTQNDLSKLTKIPQNTISQYETGKIEPTFDTISKIAEKCNFKIEFKNKDYILTSQNIDRKEI